MYLCMQREVVVAIDEACRINNETTPSVERLEQRLGEIISKTHTNIIKNIGTTEIACSCRSRKRNGIFRGGKF